MFNWLIEAQAIENWVIISWLLIVLWLIGKADRGGGHYGK